MPHRYRLYPVLTIATVGLNPVGGCSAVAGNGPTGPQRIVEVPGDGRALDYFPSTSPKRWEYDVEYAAPVFRGRGKTVTTAHAREVDGMEYEALTTSLTATPWDDTPTTRYRTSPRGIMIHPDAGGEGPLFLPRPLEPGFQWTTRRDNGLVTHEVIGREEVTCGGTTCRGGMTVVSSHGPDATGFRWLAPDLGLVKHETHGSGLSILMTLTGFQQ